MIFRRGLDTDSRQINETPIRLDATSLSSPLTFHLLPAGVWTPGWILSAATFLLVWLQRVCVYACIRVCVSSIRGALAELITLAKLLPVHRKDCPCFCVGLCVSLCVCAFVKTPRFPRHFNCIYPISSFGSVQRGITLSFSAAISQLQCLKPLWRRWFGNPEASAMSCRQSLHSSLSPSRPGCKMNSAVETLIGRNAEVEQQHLVSLR